ncbi:MAG: hypothetical protein L0Z50_18215 [Verrucomicrobiales bacterium]|nr:hypothetical protein [Verrucomicrobiales bacterium]
MVALPSSAMALTVSVLEEKPPLASLFATRFGETWTPAQEAMLLDRIAGRFNSQHEAQQYEIVVRFIFSNQQEISHDAVQRLTIDAVGALLKRNHRGTS